MSTQDDEDLQGRVGPFRTYVERVRPDGRQGWHNNTEPVQSRLSDQQGGATRQATRPEKTDGSARGSWGLELRKQ